MEIYSWKTAKSIINAREDVKIEVGRILTTSYAVFEVIDNREKNI